MSYHNTVVYLDFDGVLNGRATRGPDPPPGKEADPIACGLSGLAPSRVRRVERLCQEAGAGIVVHSSWRLSWTYSELVSLLRAAGITVPILRMAPTHFVARDLAISTDLSLNKPENYVIIDDEDWFREDPWAIGHMVTTDWDAGGITDEDVEKALAILRGTEAP